MSKTIAGRKPVSLKTSFVSLDIFGNKLTVPEDIKKDIEEKGQVFRWVDAKKMRENQGYHDKGWVAYKRPATMSSGLLGNDPDGLVIRGSMMLAVRDKELNEQHQLYLKNRSAAMSGSLQKTKKELKEQADSVGSKVIDGYDDEEDNE